MGVIVFDNLLTDQETLANSDYSSQATGYPVTNAYDINRRRKKWRSANNFEIVSGDNTLVFREQVGVDITATITAGSYASDALFFAAVKTALEDVGVATYTVSRDSVTKRIEIASNLGGGAAVFQLILTDANSADMAGILGFDTAANLTGASSYEADLLRVHTSEWIEWDFGIPVNPSAFVALTARNSVLQISPTATVRLQGNWTNTWTPAAETFTLTYKDFILAQVNETGIAQSVTAGYRFWRMQIIDRDNPDLFVELGISSLWQSIDVTRGCPVFPFDVPNQDRTVVAFSEAGQTFAARRDNTNTFGLNWQALDVATVEAFQNFFERVGTHTSFMIAMDNEEAFSTDSDKWIRIVKFDRDMVNSLVRPGIWESRWLLREEL
jgi:hypothetical protein